MKKTILSIFAFLACWQMVQAQQKQYDIACLAFYNFENLFDTLDSPNTNDSEFTPNGSNNYTGAIYREKLDHLAEVVSQLGVEKTPDGAAILGIGEIENRSVLEDFVKHPLVEKRNYQIVHYDSPDKRGVDVGMIYNPKYFTVTESRNINPNLFNDKGDTVFTRDILFVKGQFRGEELFVFVNHWPSRRGGEKATAPLREGAAKVCKRLIDSITAINPNAKIVLMGDLNDNPNDPSCKNILLAKANMDEVTPTSMFNPSWNFYKQGIGTLAHRDVWGLFDQIILSYGFTQKVQAGYFFHEFQVFNKPFLISKEGQYKGYPWRTFSGSQYIGGYSDHFPTYLFLLKEKK